MPLWILNILLIYILVVLVIHGPMKNNLLVLMSFMNAIRDGRWVTVSKYG